ncbi:MAG: hypothetical protein K1W33_09125 [Clostridia bacterium]
MDRIDGFTNGTGTTISGGAVLQTPEKIIDGCYDKGYIILGESGKLYGAGICKNIGDGAGKTGEINTVLHEIHCDERFVSVVGGNGFAVAITKDGKVYATGNNSYGVLGRWIGVSRGDSNSRYRTAFEWVECPELEI